MLDCNVVMKVINEKKGIFSFYSDTDEQKISMRTISVTVDLMFLLKVLMINKSKDTHHKYQ